MIQYTPVTTLHRTLIAADIVGFGRRETALQPYLHKVLYEAVETALAGAGVPLAGCHREDRGDGMLVMAPPDAGVEPLLDAFPARLHAELRRHDRVALPEARIRLRLAVHAGYVRSGDRGADGEALTHLFRLLDAEAFKAAHAERAAPLGLIVSDYLYEQIVRPGLSLLDPLAFTELAVTRKETSCDAWVWFPPEPHAHAGRLRVVHGE
ncbi:hypothetical protein [Actinomadura sp. 9N407]|uniref:hypothetical protein n=1 Tax=Actinomadura sp. 9N407 TaxID=3375154 RepID=UPI003790FE15